MPAEDTDAYARRSGRFGTGRTTDGRGSEEEGTVRSGGRRSRRGPMVALLTSAALVTVMARRSLLRVQGLSMRPTLRAGDLVLTLPLPTARTDGPLQGRAWELRRRLVRPDALVVLSEPGDRTHLIIKRVTEITPDGVDVVGDDPGWSIDSRTFGTVPHRDVRRLVLGRVPDGAAIRERVRAALRALPRSRR